MSEAREEDIVLASAARFLVDGGEGDAASVLLSCSLEFWQSGDSTHVGDERHHALHVELTGPRVSYDILTDPNHPCTKAIEAALAAVLPRQTYIKHLTAQVKPIPIDPNWREELLEIARGVGGHGQFSSSNVVENSVVTPIQQERRDAVTMALDRGAFDAALTQAIGQSLTSSAEVVKTDETLGFIV